MRCAVCDLGYYRRAGECIECPNNPLLLVIGFLVAAVLLCISGYVLNRKAVNLAFLSIGVDYFQVLAMFANSKITWPTILKVRDSGTCLVDLRLHNMNSTLTPVVLTCVPYPEQEVFHAMSVFNLNLELTAPECSIPDLGCVADP